MSDHPSQRAAKTADGGLVEAEPTSFCNGMERGQGHLPEESRLLALVLLPKTESKSTLRLWGFWGCWGVGEAANPDGRENNQLQVSQDSRHSAHAPEDPSRRGTWRPVHLTHVWRLMITSTSDSTLICPSPRPFTDSNFSCVGFCFCLVTLNTFQRQKRTSERKTL